MNRIHVAGIALFSCSIVAPSIARANPRPLPFTYIHESLAEGESEVEQYVDYVPVHATNANNGALGWYGATQFQTEFEHGITDRLELGLYVTYVPTTVAFDNVPALTEGTGLKERLRFKLADTGVWPIDVALYGEVTENDREIELEAKVILQRRIGALRVVANAWAEREYYFDGSKEWVLNPTIGLTYGGSATVQPGFEYWMRAEYRDGGYPAGTTAPAASHYLGPAMLLQLGKLWWSSGVYYRVNDVAPSPDGTGLSRFWVRSVVGFGL